MQRLMFYTLILALLAACGGPDTPASTAVPQQPSNNQGMATSLPMPTATFITSDPTNPPPTEAPPLSDMLPTYTPTASTEAPVATEAPAQQSTKPTITLSAPAVGETVYGSVRIEGVASVTPFEKAMLAEVRDGEGNILGTVGIMTEGEYGEPALFGVDLTFNAPASTRPGKVVVYDTSEADGSIFAIGTVDVMLRGTVADLPVISLPAAGSLTTLPLHVETMNVEPDTTYTVQVQWLDGTQLEQQVQSLPMGDRGTIVANIDWATESAPPNPPTQDAVVNILDSNGVTVASSTVRIANHADEALVRPIKLYFLLGEELQEVTRYVPRNEAVGTAVLRELSWGPAGNESAAAGMTTALPTPQEVARSMAPRNEWSGRAYLRSLKIENGVAYIDWSREMTAWGGGSTRLHFFGEQVVTSLKQFPSVESIQMTVEGSQEVLQP